VRGHPGRISFLPPLFARGDDILRPIYFSAGVVLVVIGVIGIFVPLLPTTSFLILAAWCFARSSRRAEAWLLNHPHLGPPIVAWRDQRAIARKHKYMSIGGMAVGMALFVVTARPALWLALLVASALLLLMIFVARRPEPAKVTH